MPEHNILGAPKPGTRPDLVMELLSARDRLGDRMWPLPTALSAVIDNLREQGLVETMPGMVPRTIRASLTDTGRDLYQSTTWHGGEDDEDNRSLGLNLDSVGAEDGHLHARIISDGTSDLLLTMALGMAHMLDAMKASNYVEQTIIPRATAGLAEREYVMTIARGGHPSAHDFRKKAEAEAQQLRELVRRTADALRTGAAKDPQRLQAVIADLDVPASVDEPATV